MCGLLIVHSLLTESTMCEPGFVRFPLCLAVHVDNIVWSTTKHGYNNDWIKNAKLQKKCLISED